MIGRLLVLLLVAVATPSTAWAAWQDEPRLTTTASTAVVAPPARFECSGLGLGSVRFTWSSVPGATSYTLHYRTALGPASRSTTALAEDVSGLLSGGNAWVTATFGPTEWTSRPSVERTYTFVVVSICG